MHAAQQGATSVLHHGRGLSRESLLLHQCRSIWVPRVGVAPCCAALGFALGTAPELQSSGSWWRSLPVGALTSWLLAHSVLCGIRAVEELLMGCDSDEIADRRASPPLLGLLGCSLASPVGWLLGRAVSGAPDAIS
jgi:hypothetical protein|eukprot:COSAG03_NODE_1964_length_3289_cov_2.261129_2_plen_136_part_00